ncbi:serine hydrolase [Dyadobacter luticola]|uniref:Serine hydrolase n=1 Tax=Dyadobacter luticola TaxID=1979387 RepID=A0A5R9L3G4_9BACT|nr:serine hydrolase [Dyadobacter luticola]TLV02927.1 serine hydrolase [Dyadobacter luticola]
MKKTLRFPLLFFCFKLLISFDLSAQISSNEVDALVQDALVKFQVAGASVAIVKDGKVVHKKGYGVRSVETKQPVDDRTNFQIASNSKAFTTAALAILVDEGKISWKDKVKKHIPEFKMYNEYVTENFLVEDLLCHRSGLGLGAGDLMFFPDGTDFTIKDVLSSFQYFKPVSAFRTQFDYDNQLYFVAGEVIARVTGMSWEKFVHSRIIEPLGMDHTYTSVAEVTDKINLAMPHSTENSETNKIRKIDLFIEAISGAAGGILSNADDMSKWMITQLNKGKYGPNLEKQLFTEARQREMWTIHTVTGVNRDPRYNSHFAGYGLGWDLADIKGNLRASHTGGLPGMLSTVVLIPDQKLGIMILTNTEAGGAGLFSALSRTLVDSYLGIDKTDKVDWISRISKNLQAGRSYGDSVTTKVWQTVAAAKNTPVKANDYVGVYEDKWFGKVEVFLKGDQLWFKCYRSKRLNGPMHFYKANTFAIKWEYQDMDCDAFASFVLDENGKAQSIKMKGISPNIDFSFDFHDLDLQRVGK